MVSARSTSPSARRGSRPRAHPESQFRACDRERSGPNGVACEASSNLKDAGVFGSGDVAISPRSGKSNAAVEPVGEQRAEHRPQRRALPQRIVAAAAAMSSISRRCRSRRCRGLRCRRDWASRPVPGSADRGCSGRGTSVRCPRQPRSFGTAPGRQSRGGARRCRSRLLSLTVSLPSASTVKVVAASAPSCSKPSPPSSMSLAKQRLIFLEGRPCRRHASTVYCALSVGEMNWSGWF